MRWQVAEMASLSHALWERRRRRASVSIKIEYTRMALPYGWTRQVDPSTGVTYYVLTSTGQRRRAAPSYSHLDDLAARQLQAAWRGFLAKRDFGRMLNEESPVVLAQTAIQVSRGLEEGERASGRGWQTERGRREVVDSCHR